MGGEEEEVLILDRYIMQRASEVVTGTGTEVGLSLEWWGLNEQTQQGVYLFGLLSRLLTAAICFDWENEC